MRRGRAGNHQHGKSRFSTFSSFHEDDEFHSNGIHGHDNGSTDYYLEYYRTMQKSDFTHHQSLSRNRAKRIKRNRILSCFAYFSLVGVIFLLFIGLLIETQPIYIKGLHKRRFRMNNSNSYSSLKSSEKEPQDGRAFKESSNAYKAAFAYFCTMLICAFSIRYDERIAIRWNQWRNLARYREVSDLGSNFIYREDLRQGYGTFELWKRKIVSATPGIKWFREGDKSKKR